MSDNTSQSGNDTIATDDIGGIKYQRVKVTFGTDGSATDVSTSNALPVSDAGATLSVDDGGSSLTVDGTVSVNALPAGTNNIGDVDVATLPGTVATDINTLAGAVSSAKVQVDVQTMPAADVTTDSIGAAPLAETSLAGATPYKLNSAASTNATSVKASTGKVYSIVLTNQNAATRYVKFYNKSSAPTVGTDTPVWVCAVPGGSAGAGMVVALPMPLKFSTGIAFAITTGAADSDTGAVAANDVIVNLGYA